MSPAFSWEHDIAGGWWLSKAEVRVAHVWAGTNGIVFALVLVGEHSPRGPFPTEAIAKSAILREFLAAEA